MRILVIEICNFIDFPTGGQLSFVRNMMKAYGDEVCLAGCSTDDTSVGKWTVKEIDGTEYEYFSVLRMKKDSRRPIIPGRVKGYLALKRHIGSILKHDFDWIFIQAPEVLFALPEKVLGKVAIDLPGLNNPLSISRYGFARRFDKVFDKLFLKKLSKVGHIWATGSLADIRDLIGRSGGALEEDEIIQFPTRYDSGIFRPKDRSSCRLEKGIPDGCRLIVSVGRLNIHKGWPLMLEAVSKLKAEGMDLKFILIGEGEDEEDIKLSSGRLGLDNVITLTGRLGPEDISTWLNAADAFVMGSEKEGWSTTLVEACACGVPCVVTDFSSAEDMISDGVNGFVVRQRDAALFAESISSAIALDRDAVAGYDRRFETLAISKLKSEMDGIFNKQPALKGNRRRRHFCARMLSVMLLSAASIQALNGKEVRISNQKDFDNIRAVIEEMAAKGEKDICVNIDKGAYCFRNKHIALYNKDWSGINISIRGNGSEIMAAGHVYKDGERFIGDFQPDGITFLNEGGRAVDIFGQTCTAKSLVRIIDGDTRECVLSGEKGINMSADECKDVHIRLTEWYWARTYKVTRIDDGEIHFIADDLQKVSPVGYNVNYDFIYGMKKPRYRLCNIPGLTQVLVSSGKMHLDGIKRIRTCEASCFLETANSSIGGINVSGISFKGSGGDVLKSLISSYKTDCGHFTIESCSFENISSVVIGAEFTDGIEVRGNTFKDCRVHVISLSSTCDGCTVSGNTFRDCGKSLGPWHCITICGDRYRINDNEICDFGYGGIFVGCTVDMLQAKAPGGTVEGNRLWMTHEFVADHEKYTMMDSGAIYVSTCNDVAVIRNNVISDISGMKDNRGIFLDDGASNVTICGNKVTGIRNSYSIDSRRITQFETPERKNNVNNKIHDNITDSPIRFEGNEADASCEIGGMKLVKDNAGKYPKIRTSNVRTTSENTYLRKASK